jgi:lipopolysaccharide/colanic/teichoic acid biosynthesis glycosyltransferase
MYIQFIKRLVDFFGALSAIILFSPLIVLLSFVLTFSNRGKPFFFQKRPGRHGKIFTIIKFKTMNNKKDKDGNLLPDLERITRIGRFIRNTSLDELLQLFNVLIGDMSIVGPRPLLTEYLPLYNQEQARRHEVKPGITGWAQVNGRNAITWEQKFEYDIWYVDHVSFLTDLKIIWKTVIKVFKREGITSESGNNRSMPIFTGNH